MIGAGCLVVIVAGIIAAIIYLDRQARNEALGSFAAQHEAERKQYEIENGRDETASDNGDDR